MKTRLDLRLKRKLRVRAKISGSESRPRLSVFRSNRKLAVQLIDDTKGVTLGALAADGKTIKDGHELGLAIAKVAIAKKITVVVFDRSGFRYHGVIKSLADGAREGGLKF